jgi:general secretion pathway protein J
MIACTRHASSRHSAAPIVVGRWLGRRDARHQGFTLIELLVALAIFAVIAVMSLRAVSAALDNRAHLEAEGRKWRELGRLFATLDSDLTAALVGPGVSLSGAAAPAPGDGVWLALARAGGGEDEESVRAPRGVLYRLASAHIERSTYHSLALPGTESAIAVSRFPSDVQALSLRYLTARGDWVGDWSGAQEAVPRALEVTIALVAGESVRRVFLVR